MNRLLILIVAVAVLALLGFGVFVFTTGGQRPALASLSASGEQQPGQPGQPAASTSTTPEAAARFDAWAQQLRDAGLTLTYKSALDRGETLSVLELTIAGPEQLPTWRWTVQNASLYDQEPFHLQTAGDTTITLATGPDAEISWTGRVDAFGIALQKDPRDVLARSVIFRVNGLSLAGPGDAAPLTLGDGQLRLSLGGGTGLLPPGTRATLRLADMVLPGAEGGALGSKVKAFTTEFTLDQKLTSYAFPEVLGLFQSGSDGIALRTVALDWGTLHLLGDGAVKVGRTGLVDGRFDVSITNPLPFLDAIAAAGAADPATLAETYAALLLELGRDPSVAALPFAIAIKAGAIALEGAARGLDDIDLGHAPGIVTGAPSP